MTENCKSRVLVICLGNICRSPIAEAVFQHILVKKKKDTKWEVQSAALYGFHTGKPPDQRAMDTLREKGIKNYSHRARPITESDFNYFDFILGMDDENIFHLERMKPVDCKAKIRLLGDFDPQGEKIIRDPYYDHDRAGFVKAYEQCMRCIPAFLDMKNK